MINFYYFVEVNFDEFFFFSCKILEGGYDVVLVVFIFVKEGYDFLDEC